jgi:hypothetical protein
MSGYVPLEGVVVLAHSLVNRHSGRFDCVYVYGFEYLGGRDKDMTTKRNVLSSVVSVAVLKQFSESVISATANDIGLLSGYYLAGVVFPSELYYLLRDEMDLFEVYTLVRPSTHPNYHTPKFAYTTAWTEYICLDPDVSYVYNPPVWICTLENKHTFPFFFTYDEFRNALAD